MGIIYSFLFKCKCGYSVNVRDGSMSCRDKKNESLECVFTGYQCKNCGNIQELFEDGDIRCDCCGGKMKPIFPIVSLLFPKLLDCLPPLRCPKCGKKHMKLSKENEIDEVQKQFLEETSNPIYQSTKYVDIFTDCEFYQMEVLVKKTLLFIIILCFLVVIYIFRDFIFANLITYTLTH